MNADSFSISKQITLGEYKVYLTAIKKDSSLNYYAGQLPDSTIISKQNYLNYITDKKYDSFPAVGITWEAAINFCKWKTINKNKDGIIKYIYRLPKLSEWLDAYQYLESSKYNNDFSKNYSDWTMSMYYEGGFGLGNDTAFYDMFYLPDKNDPPRNKRMRVIGDSYLFQREKLISHSGTYFTFNGYRQVSFRIVKEKIKANNNQSSSAEKLLGYWGLKNK